jgi:hypothetical protein
VKKTILKEAGAIFVLAVLVLSSTAVLGQPENTDATMLTEIAEVSSTVINEDPVEGRGPELWNNGAPDGRNGLSCVYWPSYPLDRYVIDEFYVPEGGWDIYDGHFNIVTYQGYGPDIIDSVNVFFFYNTGPCEPTYDPDITVVPTTWDAELTGNYFFSRPEIKVNCYFDPPVTLNMPGEWWVCFQPVMEDNSFWLTAAEKECTVLVDYADLGNPRWTYGYSVFEEYYDVNFILTGPDECDPSIDVEKYIWDPDTQEWVDCDTEDEALDFERCTEITYKIVITNTGTCALYDVMVMDKLHESVEYVGADPEPIKVEVVPPDTIIEWFIPEMDQTQVIEIFLTGHVVGEDCSFDYNYVMVEATCPHGKVVRDEDWCWIHVGETSRTIFQHRLLAQIFERFPNIFPLLRQLLAL